MRAVSALLAVAALASSVLAAPTVQSPALYACRVASYEYVCDVGPCTLIARPSNDASSQLADLGEVQTTGGSTGRQPWTVNQPAGTSLTVYITNANGEVGNNSPTTVSEGSTDCLNGGAASSSSGGASTSAAGSSSAASSAASSASSALSSAASGASSAASSVSSAASSVASSISSRVSSVSSAVSSAASSHASSASAPAASQSADNGNGAGRVAAGGVLAGVLAVAAALA